MESDVNSDSTPGMFDEKRMLSDNMDGEIVSEEQGTYVVSSRANNFGEVMEHGLSQPVIFVALPKTSGWKPFGHLCLSHQTYKKKVEKQVREGRKLREVAVMGTETGEWVTVWTADGHDAIHPRDAESE